MKLSNIIKSFLLVSIAIHVQLSAGLVGTYYANDDYTNPQFQQTDATINFEWDNGSPGAGLGNDYYSVTWQGYIEFPEDSTYTFHLAHDDDFILNIDGTNLYSSTTWTGHQDTYRDSASMYFAKGYYPITLQFSERTGGAYAKLAWSNTNSIGSRQIVPASYLHESAPTSNAEYNCDGQIVANIHNAISDQTQTYSESGTNGNGLARYFRFKTAESGEMTIRQVNTRPQGGYWNHELDIGTSCNSNGTYDGSGDRDDSTTFTVSAGTWYYVRVREANNNNQLNFDITFTFIKKEIVLPAEEKMCYLPPQSEGPSCIDLGPCMGNTGCRISYPIQSYDTNDDLTNVKVYYNEDAATSDTMAETPQSLPSLDAGQQVTNITLDSTTLAEATEFSFSDPITPLQKDAAVATTATAAFTCLNEANLYASYEINGNKYAGKINACNPPQNPGYQCSKPREFALRYNKVATGDLVAIGNSNICVDDDRDGNCDADQRKRNDRNNNIFINPNSSPYIPSGYNYSNVTGAKLTLPNKAEVLWAGLYWQGSIWDIKQDNPNNQYYKTLKADKVKFKTPSSAFNEFQASNDDYSYFYVYRSTPKSYDYGGYKRYEMHYQGFYDVTNEVKTGGNGDYWVADIQATPGYLQYPGVEAAWSLQVVYKLAGEKVRTIAVNDGFVGLYGSASEGTAYANRMNSLYNLGCGTSYKSTGVYAYEVNFDIGGFKTPDTPGFSSDFTVFVTESDPDTGYNTSLPEQLSITKKDGSRFYIDGPSANPSDTDAWAYAITNKDGTDNTERTPPYIYPIGMTIKNYTKTDALSTEQSSTNMKFETDSDRLIIGAVGFATDLREPDLCYDYAYSQFGRYFTEENTNVTNALPMLKGKVSTSEPVQMKLYVKNTENSDITAEHMNINIENIDTTQVRYINNSLSIIEPDKSQFTIPPGQSSDPSYTPPNVTSGANYIHDIYIGDVGRYDFYYTYYKLQPQISSLDTPIQARVEYNVTVPVDVTPQTPNGLLEIDYNFDLSTDIELCSANGSYDPIDGSFSIVEDALFPYTLSPYVGRNFYNLNTQVVHRAGDMSIVSFDPQSLNTAKAISTVVSVETVDLQAFHNTPASCLDINNTVGNKSWYIFDNTESVALNHLFDEARPNVTLRVGANYTDVNNTDIIRIQKTAGKYNIINFPDHINYNCSADMDEAALINCFQDMTTVNRSFYCARDNFAVRPEAFNLSLYDQNQTNPSTQKQLNANPIDLAAGYSYNIKVTAVNHDDNTPTEGYTTSESNVTYFWKGSGTCSDTKDYTELITFMDGEADHNTSLDQVGVYNLNILDKTWTRVDYDDNLRLHHTGIYYKPGDDCVLDDSFVEKDGSADYKNGCEISSEHENEDIASLTYEDINTTFHPYKFDMSGLQSSVALGNDPITNTSFVYMDDVDNDNNMSVHLNGDIHAVGFNGTRTSNFKDGCYAKDVSFTLTKDANTLTTPYEGRSKTYLLDDSLIQASTHDLNNATNTFSLNSASFGGDLNGTMRTQFDMNFARTVNMAVNPQDVNFSTYTMTCQNSTECTFHADNISNKTTNGIFGMNNKVIHYYARTNAPRQKFVGPKNTTFNAVMNYEVYCDKSNGCDTTLLPNGSINPSDPRWFINSAHNDDYGKANIVRQRRTPRIVTVGTQPNGNHQDTFQVTYDGTRGYPYITSMENNASNWLIYNRYNAGALRNEFMLEFYSNETGLVGKGDTTNTVKNKNKANNERLLKW